VGVQRLVALFEFVDSRVFDWRVFDCHVSVRVGHARALAVALQIAEGKGLGVQTLCHSSLHRTLNNVLL